jgi:hypothetical protein
LPDANCYDQAAALQALAGAVGIKLEWLFLDPFGFIKTTNLLGVGSCNNPFFKSNSTPKVIAQNNPNRTDFGNHAFCELNSKIWDACAGPHVGTEDRQQYLTASIDPTNHLSHPGGKITDITSETGITKVE